MRKLPHVLALVAAAVGLMAFPLAAGADHGTRPHTKNIHALGHSPHPASFFGATAASRNINSDIAFWDKLSFNGNYDGFRIIKNAPGNPQEIVWQHCNGDQGDIVVWEDVLVRAWNAPAPADDPATPEAENRFCDGQPVPVGFEGEPRSRPRVRGPHAARTMSSVGWKFCAPLTARARATPSKARTKCR